MNKLDKIENGICPSCGAILSTLSYHGDIILDGITSCPECGYELEPDDDNKQA